MDSDTQGIPWPKPRERRDFGIAVSDAKRLNDCWHELAEAFQARPALEGDEAHWLQHAGASPGNEEWVHRVNSRNVAEVIMRGAIRDRAFPIWLRLADGEVRADPNAITSISHKTLSTGLYLTENYPKANLEGRPLWIKNVDWHRFISGVMASRYGEQSTRPVGSELDDPLKLWLAMELRRARTAFDKSRKDQDADFEAKGLRKSGVRVKVTLKSASEICVALADATIVKAAEFSASVGMIELARDQVLQFTKEIVSTAIPLAAFVSDGGSSVIKIAAEKGQQLVADVTGAFKLALRHYHLADVSTAYPTSNTMEGNVKSSMKRRPGRSPGSGSYSKADVPLLAEMEQLIADSKAMSVRAAAQLVAGMAFGAGSFESKVSRLAKAYRSSERNRTS